MRQFAAVVVAVAATTAAAQVTLSGSVGQTEEGPVAPTPCCTAALVPAGHFELETNYSGDTAGSSFVHTSNLMLKYSLTDRIQVQVGTPNFLVGGVDTTRHSFDGLNVGVKYLVFDEGERRRSPSRLTWCSPRGATRASSRRSTCRAGCTPPRPSARSSSTRR